MKKKQLFAAALVTLLAAGFTACSSDDGVADTPQPQREITGEATMELAINLPSMSGSRTGSRTGDKPADGETVQTSGWTPGYAEGNEYRIDNVSVYFYNANKCYITKAVGTKNGNIDEDGGSDATGKTENGTDANVTRKFTVDATFSETPKYAMVVVNDNGKFTPTVGEAFNSAEKATNEVNDVMYTTHYNNGSSEAIESLSGAEKYFTMTNSTTYDATNGIGQLVEIKSNNIKSKGSTFEEGDILNVYVERIAAKVELKKASTLTVEDTSKPDLVEIKNWGLNVLNTKYYPVKELSTFTTWLSSNSSWPGEKYWNNQPKDHRCFWAVDPNYDTPDRAAGQITEFKYPEIGKGFTVVSGTNDVQYCLENTFDNNHQVQNQTTTAIIIARFMPNGVGSTAKAWVKYNGGNYTEDNLRTQLASYFATKYYTKSNDSQYTSIAASDIEITFPTGSDTIRIGETVVGYKLKSGKQNITVDVKSGVKLYYKDGNEDKTSEAKLALQELVDNGVTAIYPNGYCYYPIRISHFYENEVPLDNSKINTDSQLGRYGVVRNHWYELTVNSITKEGKPITDTTITPPDTPDDEVENAIKCSIRVLSWAKRSYTYNL